MVMNGRSQRQAFLVVAREVCTGRERVLVVVLCCGGWQCWNAGDVVCTVTGESSAGLHGPT
jgi:hypothetical protein